MPPGERHPAFEPGNRVRLEHGTYSERAVGERAMAVRSWLVEVYPDLADADFAAPLALYCRAVAREELAHIFMERQAAAKAPKLSARLLESATAAARAANELGAQLGIGPRAAAELHQIRADAQLTFNRIAREAREVQDAMRSAFERIGLGAHFDAFLEAFGHELEARYPR